jgi:hypothetical protein
MSMSYLLTNYKGRLTKCEMRSEQGKLLTQTGDLLGAVHFALPHYMLLYPFVLMIVHSDGTSIPPLHNITKEVT